MRCFPEKVSILKLFESERIHTVYFNGTTLIALNVRYIILLVHAKPGAILLLVSYLKTAYS